jgi:hypothetical protein
MDIIGPFAAITEIVVGGFPLIFVVFGCVEFAKKVGVSGGGLTWLSMGLGLLFGLAYQVTTVYPTSAADWFATVVLGLIFGIVASGAYDFVNSRTVKAA